MTDPEREIILEAVLGDKTLKRKDNTPSYPETGDAQMDEDSFDLLFTRFTVWAEKLEFAPPANTTANKEALAIVIHNGRYKNRFNPAKTKIGPFPVGNLKPKAEQSGPKFTTLGGVYNVNQCQDVRNDVVRVLNITDKSHLQHGTNFSSSQKLSQIIDNVIAPVQGVQEKTRVKELLRTKYNYKPWG